MSILATQNKINFTDMVFTVSDNMADKFCTAMGNKEFPLIWGKILPPARWRQLET